MALLQQPTEERMVSTFLTACLWYQHCFTGSLSVMNSSSRRYAYDTRKSNFPDFQGIFLYFPDFSQNLKFPWPSTKFPDFSLILNFPHFSLTSGNPAEGQQPLSDSTDLDTRRSEKGWLAKTVPWTRERKNNTTGLGSLEWTRMRWPSHIAAWLATRCTDYS